MTADVEVFGHCDPWFEPVREAFALHFARGLEHGASVALAIDGELVVDLWAGVASRRDGLAWERDTLVNLYSATKGVSALCLHLLADEGAIELDAPVASYWPEFAAGGKGEIRVRDVMCHRAGLAAIERPLPHDALYDHDRIATALAAQAPAWQVTEGHGYHPQTFGFLLGELVRRVSGRSLGTFVAERIAGPLGADLHIGLGPEHDPRVAHVTRPLGATPPPGQPDLLAVFKREPGSLTARAFANPSPSHGAVGTRAFRAAEIPGSNGHGNARALAQIYGAVAAGELLSPAAVSACQQECAMGLDKVLRVVTRFGPGFMLSQAQGGGWFSPRSQAFGHPGMGGALGFADPAAGLGFGYAMNRAGASILVGERPRRLVEACYACL